MFSRFIFAVIFGWGILASDGASFASSAEAVPAPTLDSIDAVSASAQAAHCSAAACKATETIAQAMKVLLAAQATSVGVTNPLPAGRDKTNAARLNRVLLDDPAQFAPVCDMLKGLARQYPPGDLFVAVSVLQLALRMDLRTTPAAPGACLPGLLQAFPRSAQADTAISNANILCTNAWQVGSACSRLHR
jgi:hypothetical protein